MEIDSEKTPIKVENTASPSPLIEQQENKVENINLNNDKTPIAAMRSQNDNDNIDFNLNSSSTPIKTLPQMGSPSVALATLPFNNNNNNNNNNKHKETFCADNNSIIKEESTTIDFIAEKSSIRQLALCDTILLIAQSHQILSPYTQLKREQLLQTTLRCRKHLVLPTLNPVVKGITSYTELHRLEMWRCFCALVGPDIVKIVEFAKRIPGN
jgi:hypothetical protein